MHKELGVLNGPVLVFGGPYSNRHALDALRQAATLHGVTARSMICTGDVVAYCGAPVQTVELINDIGCAVVAGNCEKQLGAGAGDCGCGFEEASTCDLLSAGWYGHADAQIGAAARDWMRACPDVVSFIHQGLRYAVIHGGYTDVSRFVWGTSPDAVFDAEWRALEADIGPVSRVFAGHSGVPFIRETPHGQWINAGVIGMPPHDGRQQTRYAVLDGGRVQIHRLSYDVEGAIADMAAAGLTQGYDSGLRTGYWPSEDILPEDLRVPSLARG